MASPDNPTKFSGLDLLGVQPVAKSIEKVTDGTVDGAAAFLSRICLPAAEEFGLLLRDQVSAWRARNAVSIARKAEEKVKHWGGTSATAHPRLAFTAIESGSWHDDEVFQEMWGGLLASSCSAEGKDDSNTVFMALLSQLTSCQVRLLNYACENSVKYCSQGGWPLAHDVKATIPKLTEVSGVDDFHRLDRELDHLRSLNLIGSSELGGGGFGPHSPNEADIAPTSLALHLYVRCQGFTGSPVEYWNLSIESAAVETSTASALSASHRRRSGTGWSVRRRGSASCRRSRVPK